MAGFFMRSHNRKTDSFMTASKAEKTAAFIDVQVVKHPFAVERQHHPIAVGLSVAAIIAHVYWMATISRKNHAAALVRRSDLQRCSTSRAAGSDFCLERNIHEKHL